jgi:hypothetical protein
MKKGKSVRLTSQKSFKITYGTVDFKNLKSVYLNIQSWAEPIEFIENAERAINYLLRCIKQTISETLNKDLFEKKFICDLDLRSSGVMVGKKSFMNLECYLYTTHHFDFKSQDLKNSIKQIADSIIKDVFMNSKTFTFTSSKKINYDMV